MSDKKKRTNKGWSNITPGGFERMDKGRLREISKRAAARSVEVRQERRTAKQCLADILTLECTEDIISGAELSPELAEQLKQYAGKITLYDLVQLVTVGQAIGGNMRAAEYLRDTYGDMPVKEIAVDSNFMSEADREMLRHIQERLNNPDTIVVADVTAKEGEDDGSDDNEDRS